ncbi:MAG: trimethylamine methyltransferase family protein [Candidatus Puniceispirillales bacterium]
MSEVRTARRSRRRDNAQQSERQAGPQQAPFKPLRNSRMQLKPLTEDHLEAIHQASMRIISEQGIKVLSASARAALRDQGCMVDDGEEIVRMDPAFVETMIAKAPSEFTLTPRNPDHALHIGGDVVHFGLVSGPPNAHDMINGRRPGNYDDFCKLIRLGQHFNCIHFMGNQAIATNDLPANTRHLDSLIATITLSDKITSSMSIGSGRVMDAARMVAIGRGISLDELRESPTAMTNINVNSPRVLDQEMSDAALMLASLGQAVIVTPFTLMGAMTPVTLPAALAQQNAEALFTIALIQSQHPGAPVIYGGFTSNVDMKSGAPAFGTPENTRANMAGGQLARHYNLPHRTSSCNASNVVDAQAAYETQMALWGAVTGGANLIYHGAGWLEGGLVSSFEKVILDAEMLQMMIKLFDEPSFADEEFALEAMAEVGPGGHFFGCGHTLERYKDAFYEPLLSDWQNNENWQADGSKTATERATVIWQQILEQSEPPALDLAIVEELHAYVAKRKEEIGQGEP